MDNKISLSNIIIGVGTFVMFFVVLNNLESWDFTNADRLEIILITGFMALWGLNISVESIENFIFRSGVYIHDKYFKSV
ncbi:MAG: hypothetical protein WC998_06285 [Candidatus Paceibacterota bacterium]|jgi:hypothetical protein